MPDPSTRFYPRLFERARAVCPVVVFPEGDDGRILEGALRAHRDGFCRAVLLAPAGKIATLVATLPEPPPPDVEFVDPATDARLDDFAATYRRERRRLVGKDVGERAARRLLQRPLFFAAMMVWTGEAAGMVAGARETTADVLTAATGVIGLMEGVTEPTSGFVMVAPDDRHAASDVIVFADGAVNPAPSPPELARIAVEAARLLRQVTGEEPRVALLSFSTAGSADHALVDRVREAGRRLAAMQPEFAFDVEVQVDAAVVPAIAARKHPASRVGGRANVLVFPDLNSGNIAYKLAERLGGWHALGPFTLGLRRPISDLSRGATADDIHRTTAILACRATVERG